MDTRFELNVKKVSIKGDDKAVYLYYEGTLLLKFAYRDIKKAAAFLLTKAQEPMLLDQEGVLLEDSHFEEE